MKREVLPIGQALIRGKFPQRALLQTVRAPEKKEREARAPSVPRLFTVLQEPRAKERQLAAERGRVRRQAQAHVQMQ